MCILEAISLYKSLGGERVQNTQHGRNYFGYANHDLGNNDKLFQGEDLLQDNRRGIIINQHSLVIQRVDRQSAGKYVCQATNMAGTGSSAEVTLDIKCKYKNLVNVQI